MAVGMEFVLLLHLDNQDSTGFNSAQCRNAVKIGISEVKMTV